jgi:hypothetical protein
MYSDGSLAIIEVVQYQAAYMKFCASITLLSFMLKLKNNNILSAQKYITLSVLDQTSHVKSNVV